MFAVFKESARQKNARDRFELFMKLLAAFRRKRRASKDARLIFLQTNTEFFQESCLHRRQPYSEAGFEQ